jgi:tRNA (cmo5U34)-methyltransferase
MMAVGRERMARFGDRFSYHVGDLSNGELPTDLPGPFDAAVTSAFILHLSSEAKRRLYGELFRILNPGGCFVNVDLVRPANEEMASWYHERWELELQHRGDQPSPDALMQRHQVCPEAHLRHHHVETEADQLASLRAAGFVRVDCFYKRLLQAVIGGYKPVKNG